MIKYRIMYYLFVPIDLLSTSQKPRHHLAEVHEISKRRRRV